VGWPTGPSPRCWWPVGPCQAGPRRRRTAGPGPPATAVLASGGVTRSGPLRWRRWVSGAPAGPDRPVGASGPAHPGLVAALPVAVLGRFGHDGVVAHRLASGLDPFRWTLALPPTIYRHRGRPPARRWTGRRSWPRLHADELPANGLACTHVLVEAETEHGESLARAWRHDGTLDVGALADRVRWQLDGWLTGSATMRPGGHHRLTLVPLAVVAASGRPRVLGRETGSTSGSSARGPVEGIVGEGAVTVPEARGGRGRASGSCGCRWCGRPPAPAVRPSGAVVEPWPGRVQPRPVVSGHRAGAGGGGRRRRPAGQV
jgi:protein ImuB